MQCVAPHTALRPDAARMPHGTLRKVVAGASSIALLCLIVASTTGSGQRTTLYEGRQQQLFNGVRDASSMFSNQPQSDSLTAMLKDAAKAARGAGGDSTDMAAMAAAMNYRKEHGKGKMQYAKGHLPVHTAPKPQKSKEYGAGVSAVAAQGERAIAKQLSDDNEARTQSVMPEHVIEPQHTKSQAQIAKAEMDNNDREADSMLPEHNQEAAHKSREQIRNDEINYNTDHANAMMPSSRKHSVQGLKLKDRADQAQSEEDADAKRADAIIVPDLSEDAKPKVRTQAQIRKSEEQYNEKHADAMLPEHNVEVAHKSQAQIRKSEEQYNSKHADAILPEHNTEGAKKTRSQIRNEEEHYNALHASKIVTEHTQKKQVHRTQAQIRASEEKDNEKRARAVLPADSSTQRRVQRLSVAEQTAQDEQQIEGSASNVVVSDDSIDKYMNAAREQETARDRAFEQDVNEQRASLQRSRKQQSKSNTQSYSYDRLYEQALKKEESKNRVHRMSKARDESKMEQHMQSQIADIEGKVSHKMTQDQIHQKQVEQQNYQHIQSQIAAITAGPRDVTHMLSGPRDEAQIAAAIRADNSHLESQVADITSGLEPAVAFAKSSAPSKRAEPSKKAVEVRPKVAKRRVVPHKKDVKADTAKMMAAAHMLDTARDKKLFNVYTKSTTKTATKKSWAAKSVAESMAVAKANLLKTRH